MFEKKIIKDPVVEHTFGLAYFSPGENQEKLASTVNKYHGEAPADDKAELIKDNVSEGDSTEKLDIDEDRKWKKQDET